MFIPDRRCGRAIRPVATTLWLALASPALAQSSTSEPAHAPAAHFYVRAYQVRGNHWLSPGAVEAAVYPFMGPDRTAADVEGARAALQARFAKAGYATVSVSIPEQGVESGIIALEVQPQAVGRLTVKGASGAEAAWIRAHAPSLQPGATPDFNAVQKDIVALNVSVDRKVTPEVTAGVAPGTVDVALKVEDHLPLHGSLEFNNDASPETTPYRLLGTLTASDLWGRGDSFTASAQTAPERSADATVASANALTHLGPVQLLSYFVYSDSDVAVVGGTDVVGKGVMAGFRFVVPVSQSPRFYQSITAGLDYKHFGEDVRLGADRSTVPIAYFPASIGWRGDWTYDHQKSDLSLTATFGLRGLGDDVAAFDAKRFGAKPDFFLAKLDGSHTQDLWGGTQGWVHVSGQWSGDALVSNEEFSLGGLSTVRGYFESEALGDFGAAIQSELRTPNLAQFTDWSQLNELRVHAFYDAGWTRTYATLPGQRASVWLASAGLGAATRLVNHANGAVEVGMPLVSGPNTKTETVFTRFRIWGDF